MNGTRSLPKHNHFNVSLESILPLYEESVRIDYVESVFNWKGAAQRSRFAYIPWAINLKKGPGAGQRPREQKIEGNEKDAVKRICKIWVWLINAGAPDKRRSAR